MWQPWVDSEFEARLSWADEFVRREVEPMDLVFAELRPSPRMRPLVSALQDEVRAQGLWAAHLEPEWGGQGYGQVKLALLNEVLGRCRWAPLIFGCNAPDTGNAEILARYGTDPQKEQYLAPLLRGEIYSCYSMTEPQGGSDPQQFRTRGRRDGAEWVISGEKYFASSIEHATFALVMVITDPDVSVHKGSSIFLIPTDTFGLEVLRHVGTMGTPLNRGNHGWIRFNDVRVPSDNLVGTEGEGFLVAQTRLSGGRVHHAMRAVAKCRLAFDMMCERAVSRETQGSLLADKQFVQGAIADSWTEILQLRLMVLHTAELIDRIQNYAKVRKEIAACKVEAERVLLNVVHRAMHLHGALGVTNETPLAELWMSAPWMGITDGPTEVHKVTIAKQILRDYEPSTGTFPSRWLPPLIEEAEAKFKPYLNEA